MCVRYISSITKSCTSHSSVEKESEIDIIYRAWKQESTELTVQAMSEEKLYQLSKKTVFQKMAIGLTVEAKMDQVLCV